jgi:hypothetical protein
MIHSSDNSFDFYLQDTSCNTQMRRIQQFSKDTLAPIPTVIQQIYKAKRVTKSIQIMPRTFLLHSCFLRTQFEHLSPWLTKHRIRVVPSYKRRNSYYVSARPYFWDLIVHNVPQAAVHTMRWLVEVVGGEAKDLQPLSKPTFNPFYSRWRDRNIEEKWEDGLVTSLGYFDGEGVTWVLYEEPCQCIVCNEGWIWLKIKLENVLRKWKDLNRWTVDWKMDWFFDGDTS